MHILRFVLLLFLCGLITACGSSSSGSSASSVNSNTDNSSESGDSSLVSSSSEAPSSSVSSDSSDQTSSAAATHTYLPFYEDFDQVVDANGFFSTAYKALASKESSLYYSTAGVPEFSDGQITLASARFTIANTTPDVGTTSTDAAVQGEFDLSQPWRISFCVLASAESGDNNGLIVYVDNNQTSRGASIHGNDSRVWREEANKLIAGQRVIVDSSVGTANSFIQIRAESGASVTFDDLWVGYQADTSSEPACGDDTDPGNGSSANNSSAGSSSSVPMEPVEGLEFALSGSWFETAYAVWSPVIDAVEYQAFVKEKGTDDSAYSRVDQELIRNTRVDILGLKGGTEYTIKVVALDEFASVIAEDEFDATPDAHDRSGFAFAPSSPLGVTTGGYNLDGTVHPEARILYLTDDNKDTIELDVVTGTRGQIERAVGMAAISDLRQKGRDNEPLIIRVLGTVTSPVGLDNPEVYNLWKGTKRGKNTTIEGVGDDARISGWGIEIRDTDNVEVRNLGFGEQPDDGISIQSKNNNIWVHHNDFYWGKDMGGDKNKGDGSVDMKNLSSFITVSYNAFHDTGKGMATGFNNDTEYYITVHHNFFNASDSRHPRASNGGRLHVYNNYYWDIATYGVAAATGAHVFVENNYFEVVKRPMFISSQGHDLHGDNPFKTNHTESVWINDTIGYRSNATAVVHPGNGNNSITSRNDAGAIKQEGNYMDAWSAAWFYEELDSGSGGRGPIARPAAGIDYDDFDIGPVMYDYTAQTAVEAKETVLDFAGRMGADNRAVKFPQTNPINP